MDVANLQIKVKTDEVAKAKEELKKLGFAATDVTSKNSKLERSQFRLNKVFGASIFTVKNLIGTYLSFRTLAIADEFVLLESRVRQSTRGVEEFNTTFKQLKKDAQAAGVELGTAVEIFQRLSFVRDELDTTAKSMADFTSLVQKLGTTSGAGTQNLNAGLRQLGQALGQPIVRAEEFNSVLENIPAVAKAIGDGLGLSVAQVRNLVIEGKLASKDVFAVILAQQGKINDEFDQFLSGNQLSISLGQLRQAFQNYIGEVNKSLGITTGMAVAIRLLSENLDGVAKFFLIAAGAAAAYFSVMKIGAITSMITALKSLIGSLVATAAAYVAMLGPVGALQAAMLSLNAVIIANPLGLLAAALGAAVVAVIVFKDEFGGALGLAAEIMGNFAAIVLGALAKLMEGFIRFKNLIADVADKSFEFFASKPAKFIATKFLDISPEDFDAANGKTLTNEILDPARETPLLDGLQDELDAMLLDIGKWQDDVQRLNQESSGPIKDSSPIKALSEEAQAQLDEIQKKYGDIIGDIQNGKSKSKKRNVFKETLDSLKFENEQLFRNNEQREIYNNLRRAGVEISSAEGQQIVEATKELAKNTQEMEKQNRVVREVEGAFDSFFSSVIRGSGSFKDALSNLAGQLADLIFQLQVVEPLKNSLFGGLSGGGLGGGLGGILGGIGGFFGGGGVTASSFQASQVANIGSGLFGPGFATGGSFTVGGIGGPDSQFVPLRLTPGEHVNIQKGGQGNSGQPTIINIDARGAEAGVEEKIRSVMNEITRLRQETPSIAVNSIQNANRRNPSLLGR